MPTLITDGWRDKKRDIKTIRGIRTKVRAKYKKALRRINELVPERTGYLRRSIGYEEINLGGNHWLIDIGSSVKYSVRYDEIVHDGPQRNWRKKGASNRFVEIPLEEIEPEIDKIIRDELDRGL